MYNLNTQLPNELIAAIGDLDVDLLNRLPSNHFNLDATQIERALRTPCQQYNASKNARAQFIQNLIVRLEASAGKDELTKIISNSESLPRVIYDLADKNDTDSLQLIIQYGLRTNNDDYLTQAALLAAEHGSLSYLRKLATLGAKLETETSFCGNLKQIACQFLCAPPCGCFCFIVLLPCICSRAYLDSLSPEEIAEQKGNTACAEFIREHIDGHSKSIG